MKLKGKITIEEITDLASKIRTAKAYDEGTAALTHYLYNSENGVSKYIKQRN